MHPSRQIRSETQGFSEGSMNNKSSARDRPLPQMRDDLASLIEQAIKAPSRAGAAAADAPRGDRGALGEPAEALPQRLIEELSAPQEAYAGASGSAEALPHRLIAELSTPQEAHAGAGGPAEALPNRLIEELSAAQEQLRAEPPREPGREPEPPAAAPAPAPASQPDPFEEANEPATETVVHAPGIAGTFRSLRGRYLALVSLVHRRVFDRRIEQLLFFKTAGPSSWLENGADGQKKFVYRGPIPEVVLGWALSALPTDLKRYAFVDFEAGNGRTLLLAARRNFEHAIGYTHDGETCAMLEMNLAQYSRSYMSCRDVRALRGDRDGIPIPMQPAVLFFPYSLSRHHLSIVLSHLSASIRLNPRSIYLIFENSGPERGLEQMTLFRKVPLPPVNRVRARLFSPANIAVYRSLNTGVAS